MANRGDLDLRKVGILFSLFLIILLGLSIFQFVPSVKAQGANYWVQVNLSKDYGYREDRVDLTVLSNSSTPHIIILDPFNATLYDQLWGVNETRTIPISNIATYGMYFVKALAGDGIATTWFTVLEVFPWDIISAPYTREWKNINYTFSKAGITAQFYGETLNIDLRMLRELIVQFGLTVSASYDKNRFRVMVSKPATVISINFTYTFNDLGCKLTIDGQLDQPRDFTFNFESLTKVKKILHKIYAGQMFFDFDDIAKVTQAFTYNPNTKELSVSVPQSFSLDPTINFDAVSMTQGEGTNLSWSHTTDSMSNRLLMVGASLRNSASQTVSSVTYGGVNLNSLRADSNGVNVRTEIWYLVNPDFGTGTIAVTFSASVKAVCGAITLLAVNQTNPFTNNNGATGTSVSPSASVTSAADDWLFGVLGTKGIDNLQDFIDQISDVDSHPDHGTHSDFTKEQTAPDTVYDTLTEANTGGTFGKSAGAGTSYLSTSANYMYLGVYSGAVSGAVTQVQFYGRGATGGYVKAVITDSGGNLLTNGVSDALAYPATAATYTCLWSGNKPSVTSGNTYWIGIIASVAGRLYYDATTGGTSKTDSTNSYTTPTSPIDAASGTYIWRLMQATVVNYELDIEEQWIAAEYSLTYEELCIKTGSLGAENLKVDVWTNPTWTTIINPLVASQWNNVSVSAYLTSSTFTMRFIGTIETGDTVQNTWQIDSVLLHTWSPTFTITEGGGQTNRWSLNTGAGTTNIYGVGSTKPVSAGAQNLSWTLSTSSPWAVSAASVAKEFGTEIFADGFESGNFSAWTGTAQSGAVIAVSTDFAHHGTYSAKITGLGIAGEYAYAYKTSTSALSNVYMRSYVKFGNLSTADGFIEVGTAAFTDTVRSTLIAKAGRNFATNKWSIRAYVGTALTNYYESGTSTIDTNTWYSVELHEIISATVGVLQLWVDGVLKIDQSGLVTNGRGNIDELLVGSQYLNTATSPDYYFYNDCTVVANAYIGVEAAGVNYVADLSKSITSTWNIVTQSAFQIVTSKSLATTWNTILQWKARTDLAKTITTTWTVLTKTAFNIISPLSTTFSWVIDVIRTIAGINYIANFNQGITTSFAVLLQWNTIANLSQSISTSFLVLIRWNALTNLSQAISTTWTIVLRTAFNVNPTQTLTITWAILTQSAFNIEPSLNLVTSWVVNLIQAVQYTADLTLTVTTTWIVDILHSLYAPTYATTGFVLATIFIGFFIFGLAGILFIFLMMKKH